MQIKSLELRQSNDSKIWCCADNHWGHFNIIQYCDRPFKTSEEMDQVMIDRWNSKVGKDDIVIHLGDIFLEKRRDRVVEISESLNGQIYLIRGNHDKLPLWFYEDKCGFIVLVNDGKTPTKEASYNLNINGSLHTFKLSHYPLPQKYMIMNIHGHTHDKTIMHNFNYQSLIHVGVDATDFYPISLDAIKYNIQGLRTNMYGHLS